MAVASLVYPLALAAVALHVLLPILRMASEKDFRARSRQITEAAPVPERHYTVKDTDGLPAPVRTYFKTVLREGQAHARMVSVSHTGYFKTDLKSGWKTIEGREVFSARRPEFVWMGKTSWFTAIDSLVSGSGRLAIRLFSAFKIADFKGKDVDRSELLRWIGESAWFPTALLFSDHISWVAADDASAVLKYRHPSYEIAIDVYFSPNGKISEMHTKRHDSQGNLRPWIGRYSHYQRHGGMLVPSRIEALWVVDGEEMPYARFTLKQIQYT